MELRSSIEPIEDWAFVHSDSLSVLGLPSFGRGAFLFRTMGIFDGIFPYVARGGLSRFKISPSWL